MSDLATRDPMPAPAIERRDDIGRLVAVTWHGAGTSVESGGARWLVAVDGSECSLRTAQAAARVAALGLDAEVDLVHVQPWLVKEAAETELSQRGWAATAQVRQMLDAASVRWRLHVVMGEAAPEIAGMAESLGSLGIAIGSHGLSAVESLLLGSVAYKIVRVAQRPVMIVR